MIRRMSALAAALVLVPAPAGAKTSVTLACTELPSVVTAPLKVRGTGERLGTIHIKKDTCYQYWGYLKLNEPIGTGGTRATAGISYWQGGGPKARPHL